jgi:hypothetical protein
MARSVDDEDEKPLDPAVERVRRRVMRFIAINLGILFLALMAVAIAIVYRIGSREDDPPVAVNPAVPAGTIAAEGAISLPAGARIVSHSLSGGLMAVEIEDDGGERAFLIYDLTTGSVVSRVAVEAGR